MERLESVDRLLDWLEEHIDEAHCRLVEQKHVDTIAGRNTDALPLAVYCPTADPLFSTREAFDDPEKMLYNELLQSGEFGNIRCSVYAKDDYPLQIRSNHGIALSHNLAGGAYTLPAGTTPPWADAYPSLAAYRREWENKPYAMDTGVPRKVFSTYRHYKDRLAEYPKCARTIRLSRPDMQSPFNIAQSLIGSELFYALYDSPDDVHWLLDRICNVYILFHLAIDPFVNDATRDGAHTYVMGAIFPGKALLKEDTAAANLSRAHILEFCRPYNLRVAEALGTCSLHYCGSSQPFHPEVFGMPALGAVNFGDPHRQDVAAVIRDWQEAGVAIVNWGYHRAPAFLAASLRGHDPRRFTLCASCENEEQAAEIVGQYRLHGLSAFDA